MKPYVYFRTYQLRQARRPATFRLTSRRVLAAGAAAGLIAAAMMVTVRATPSVGLTPTPIARATIPNDFKVHANIGDLDVKLESKGPVDAVVNNNKLAPGGTVGWHSHTGPVIVLIRKGSATIYEADCSSRVVYAGEAFVENVTGSPNSTAADLHNVRNEGIEDLEWTATSLVPVSAPGRIDQPAPATCPL